MKYVNEDVFGKLNDKLKVGKENLQTNETIKAINDAQDALASTIISKNVSQEVLNLIRYHTSVYYIMEKLKTLYGKKKIADLNYWLKKLYSFKAKNLSDFKNIINQIKEIFEFMKKDNILLGTWENIRVLYLSYSKILKDLINPSGTETVDSFLEKYIKKINFQIFLQSAINFDRSTIDKVEILITLNHTAIKIIKPNQVLNQITISCVKRLDTLPMNAN